MTPADSLEPTLPRDAYIAPAAFDRERELIFAREWFLVAREESIPAEGDYPEVEVAGESMLLVRGEGGVLRAFFNVCRHRGCSLLLKDKCNSGAGATPATGNFGKSIRCPYHSWTYALDGSLRTAPFIEAALGGRQQAF